MPLVLLQYRPLLALRGLVLLQGRVIRSCHDNAALPGPVGPSLDDVRVFTFGAVRVCTLRDAPGEAHQVLVLGKSVDTLGLQTIRSRSSAFSLERHSMTGTYHF